MSATASATSETLEAPPPASPARAPRRPPIELTAKAAEMVKKALDEQNKQGLELKFLRVGVLGGGCSGFNYDLDLVKESKPTDFQFEMEGLSVCIDPMERAVSQGHLDRLLRGPDQSDEGRLQVQQPERQAHLRLSGRLLGVVSRP